MHNSIIALAFVLMLVAPAVAASRTAREIKLKRPRRISRRRRPGLPMPLPQNAMLIYAAGTEAQAHITATHAIAFTAASTAALDHPAAPQVASATPESLSVEASATETTTASTGAEPATGMSAAQQTFHQPDLHVPSAATEDEAHAACFRATPTRVQTAGCTWYQLCSAAVYDRFPQASQNAADDASEDVALPHAGSHAQPAETAAKRHWMETSFREPAFTPIFQAIRNRFSKPQPGRTSPAAQPVPVPAYGFRSASQDYAHSGYATSQNQWEPEYAERPEEHEQQEYMPAAVQPQYANVVQMMPAPYGYPHMMPWVPTQGYPNPYPNPYPAPYPYPMQVQYQGQMHYLVPVAQQGPFLVGGPVPYAQPLQAAVPQRGQGWYPMAGYPPQPAYAPGPQPVPMQPAAGRPATEYIRKRPSRR